MLDTRISFWLLAATAGTSLAAPSTGVGDYIASGLGDNTSSTTISLSPTDVVAEALVTVDGNVFTATLLEDGEIEVANTTIYPSSYSTQTPKYANTTQASTRSSISTKVESSSVSLSQKSDENGSLVKSTATSSPKSSVVKPSRSLSAASSTPKPAGRSGTFVSSGSPAATSKPSNGSVDDCYSSWSVYWSASQASYNASVTYDPYEASSIATGTSTGTYVETYDAQAATTQTNYYTEDITSYEVDGGFTLSTSVVETTSTYYYTYSSEPASTYMYTYTTTEYSVAGPSAVSVPPVPSCTLPQVVPACQTSWEQWLATQLAPSPTPPPHCDINAGFLNNRTVPACALAYSTAEMSYYNYIGGTDQYLGTPACTAASIGGALCQSVRDDYQMDENNILWPTLPQGDPFFFNQGTQGFFNGVNTSWIWPTSATMGPVPSCTLGCGRCAITGGTVQLLYWGPSATPTPTAGQFNGSSLNSSQALASPSPTATGPATAVTLGTTLTSPTLYISYASVYAENACGGVGTTIGETILPIPTDSALSSVYAITIPCDAHFRPTQVNTFTAPFTIGDLTENNGTVPYSIYSSQPVCQTYLRNHGCEGTCPTTAPYKPILVVPDAVLREMQPAWSNCWGDIRGVYDPPIALTAAQAVAVASNTFGTTSATAATPTSATPASGPGQTTAAPTTTTVTPAQSEVLPSSTSSVPAAISILTIALSQQQQSSSAEAVSGPASQVTSPVSGAQSLASQPSSPASVQSPANADPAQTSPAVATVDSQTFTISPAGSSSVAIANGGSTTVLAVASAATIGGQQVSVASSGGVVIGTGPAASSLTVSGTPASSNPQATVVGSGSEAVTISAAGANSIAIVNDGVTATLAAGASTSLNGQQVSVGSSGAVIVGGSVTVTAAQLSSDASPALTVVTVGSAAVTLSPISGGSSVVVAEAGQTKTLVAGAAAGTVDGQLVSVASGGSVVVGSGASATNVAVVVAASTASNAIFSIGSQAVSVSEVRSGVVIAENGMTVTLAPGSVTTIDGQQVSVGSAGVVVVGTGSAATTLTAPTAAASTSTTSSSHGTASVGSVSPVSTTQRSGVASDHIRTSSLITIATLLILVAGFAIC